MKNMILTLLLLLAAAFACAQGNYYDNVINLSGQQLYSALRTLISTNTNSDYGAAKEFLFQQLDNHNGYVTCIYTGEEYYVGYNYTGSNNPNTEHTYAQSWFSSNESSRKKADLHHLFPSNSVVNSSRGNYPLFTVANHASANVYYNDTPWQSYRGQSSGGYTVFEPADESKGNIARALLYFNTRYNDSLTQQNVNMTPVLVQWHFADPPDAAEISRNNGIYGFQTNRNPYVDHPEFVGRIWGGVAVDEETASPAAELSLDRVWPNPFSDSTTLSVQSKEARQASVSVHDVKGRIVSSWSQVLTAGNSEISWNGRDKEGQKAAPGVYLIRLHSDGLNASAKVLMSQ
ncbi:MAG TPA: endonuclease [Candidatus Syntrophosphaera sp.]|nr:endonuclease [Candidatus Syntrophosphaera sp.]